MRSRISCSTIALMLLGVANAQIGQDVTISHGNMVYRQGPLSATSHNAVAADIRCLGPGGNDHAFAMWWYYRLAGEQREFAFQDDTNVSRIGLPSKMTTRWSNVSGKGFRAKLIVEVTDGIAVDFVHHKMEIWNTGNVPMTLDLLCYADLDVSGTPAGDSATGDVHGHTVTDGMTLTNLEFFSSDNQQTEVLPYPQLQTLLTNNQVDNLRGWTPPWGPGDYTGALQWQNLTLAANERKSVEVYVLCDTPLAQFPASETYGSSTFGGAGQPELEANAVVQQSGGSMLSFELVGAVSLTPGVFLLNLAPASLPLLPGITVWVMPTGAISLLAMTSSAGSAGLSLALPPSPPLVGLDLYGQGFVLDPSVPGTNVAATHGIRAHVGG